MQRACRKTQRSGWIFFFVILFHCISWRWCVNTLITARPRQSRSSSCRSSRRMPHTCWGTVHSRFLRQLSCLIATDTEIESIACPRSLAVLAHYRDKMSPNDGLGSLWSDIKRNVSQSSLWTLCIVVKRSEENLLCNISNFKPYCEPIYLISRD